MPLLPRRVLGMPLTLPPPVVGMSQDTNTQILGLTKTNYNISRISHKVQMSHKLSRSISLLYKAVQS